MTETRPSRVLELPGETGSDSVQQYVEVGSNMYLGTKDGIKYTLLQTPDSKLHLVEALNDSTNSLKASTGSVPSLRNYENQCQVTWSDLEQGSNVIKLLSVKQEPSPCKGQGDEFGNSVVSPLTDFTFNELDDAKGNIHQKETSLSLDNSSDLTYVTLLPVQEKSESTDSSYHVTPRSFYSPTYYHPPIAIRPPRCAGRRSRMSRVFDPSYSPIPRPRGRGRGSRMRRRRMVAYQYTPQVLHSTPTNLSSMSYSSDACVPLPESSSGNLSGSSLDKSSSIEYPRAPNNTPTSSDVDSSGNQKVFSLQWMPHITSQVENYVSQDPRETHNQKERKRRLRIKEACHRMKSLVPYITEKTDNATVFEYAADFIEFIRSKIGNTHDKEFLQQNYILQVHQ